ncbi:MAG: M23 family metallopeptidase [Sphingobacteriales bacterium]|nr:MAG: M23 family metallopeptidase [Sphingobacteriales bacterium]
MLVYLLILLTLLPAFASVRLATDHRRAFHRVLAAIALACFIYLYGAWVYLSAYTGYFFGLVFLLALALGFRKNQKGGKQSALLSWIVTLVAGTLSVLYYTGTGSVPEAVELQFPLRQGSYFILQGGKGLPANLFHYSYRGASYAIDLVRLDKSGRRASAVFSSRLDDYFIFNDTIYSPCDGLVKQARDGNRDNIPPDRTRGPSNTNAVLIENDSSYVFLGHLRHWGVFVKEGMQLRAGQPLGLVGNSGFSLEPHLHIQAHKRSGTGRPWYQEPAMHIHFDGKAYLLFQTIRPRRVEMVKENQ